MVNCEPVTFSAEGCAAAANCASDLVAMQQSFGGMTLVELRELCTTQSSSGCANPAPY